ncbi:SufE family protein [Formicincola oecophyllae]|uniref:SufE family protein n=1 Tax=Formicincola oecophyllae TaxID=2558361 RepID=A0A4Y6UAB4_9PROT|nr:SufE family protein [Formicincola oecophyllae]QDH13085.1 SufE family protein [Formicincola oecophyllae]
MTDHASPTTHPSSLPSSAGGASAQSLPPWVVLPQEETAAEAITAIGDELALFDDWMQRYQYIIELGRTLPALPETFRNDAHRVPGCQSQVWLEIVEQDGAFFIGGASDAAIVQGLVALLLRVYSGRSAAEIEATKPDFLNRLGLVQALSSNRGNGVLAMAEVIRTRVGHALN